MVTISGIPSGKAGPVYHLSNHTFGRSIQLNQKTNSVSICGGDSIRYRKKEDGVPT
ncbi:hypothetical protein LEP1GSC061_0124 [Leptospira wolffii serovar Khorat str. Khorat-H2]|nr:hypothetical protein LEP1GSC061_0124 [Leptospira wolffii serovar Khorat str. Khorat-H2]